MTRGNPRKRSPRSWRTALYSPRARAAWRGASASDSLDNDRSQTRFRRLRCDGVRDDEEGRETHDDRRRATHHGPKPLALGNWRDDGLHQARRRHRGRNGPLGFNLELFLARLLLVRRELRDLLILE